MTEKKVKLLLTGPGRGHNITYTLGFLNNCSSIETYFLTSNYSFNKDAFPNIHVIDYYNTNKFIRILKLSWKCLSLHRFDILFMQSDIGYYVYILKALVRFNKFVFEIWSEPIINNLSSKGFVGNISRAHLHSADVIVCNWYGTYNNLQSLYPVLSLKSIVLPWGLRRYLLETHEIQSIFLKNVLNQIETDRFVLLNMRSLSDYNAVEIFLQAILIVRERNFEVFKQLYVVFWHGNNVDPVKINFVKDFILDNNMERFAWCDEHPFLAQSDIKHLLMRSNAVVNLVKHDQLSTSILEAMYLKKELLCSNIEPYRIFNERYAAYLTLLDNDPNAIANEIIRLVLNRADVNASEELLNYRKSIIDENFSPARNELKMIDFLLKLAK